MEKLPVPRKTKHGDEQLELAWIALKQAMATPLWKATGYCFLDTWDALQSHSPDTANLMHLYLILRKDLIEVLSTEAPQVIHGFGPLLSKWLPALFFFGARLRIPPGITVPKKMWRFLPDNPSILRTDGSVDFFSLTTKRHRRQLDDYYDSLEPINRGGRPKGSGGNRAYANQNDFHNDFIAKVPPDTSNGEEMAFLMGIDRSTFYRYKSKYGLPYRRES